MSGRLDVVGRTLYRTLLKLSTKFDKNPVLKALISRNSGSPLPQPLDDVIATFLGGPERTYFWPSPLLPQSVREAVQWGFRFPQNQGSTGDGSFQGVRYLTGLLQIAEKYDIIEAANTILANQKVDDLQSFSPQGQIIPVPQPGAFLVAHPCLPHWFSKAVVLICRQTLGGGTYGLCLNKPVAPTVNQFLDYVQNQESSENSQQPRLQLRTQPISMQNMDVNSLMHAAEELSLSPEESDASRPAFQALVDALEGGEEGMIHEVELDDGMVCIHVKRAAEEEEDSDSDGADEYGNEFTDSEHENVGASSREERDIEHLSAIGADFLRSLVSLQRSPRDATNVRGGGGGATPAAMSKDGHTSSNGDPLQALTKLFFSIPVLQGGPVPGIQVLHNNPRLGGEQILPAGQGGVYLGATPSGIEEIVESMDGSEDQEAYTKDIRVYIGDSGWGAMQLEGELETGSWIVVQPQKFDVFNPDFVPSSGGNLEDREQRVWQQKMWQHMLQQLGPEYAVLAAIPSEAWFDISELQI